MSPSDNTGGVSSLGDNPMDGSMIRTISQFATAVRARRVALGWTQQQLAERAGVSRSWLNGFETGKPRAELRLVMKVLDALDLDIALAPRTRVEDEIDLDDILGRFGSP